MIILRNNCYRLEDGFMKVPKELRVRFKGKRKWFGRQGRAEVVYDDLDQGGASFRPLRCGYPVSLKATRHAAST